MVGSRPSWPSPPAGAVRAAPPPRRRCGGAAGPGAMPAPESTGWTVTRAAAAGSPAGREELARRYLGVVRAYLSARWAGSALREDLNDATQEVFVECFRQGGAVEAAGAGRVPGFRAFLYGVVRNVARRFESRPVRAAGPLPEMAADDDSQSRLFDRAWAQAIMAEAARSQTIRIRPPGQTTHVSAPGDPTDDEAEARAVLGTPTTPAGSFCTTWIPSMRMAACRSSAHTVFVERFL